MQGLGGSGKAEGFAAGGGPTIGKLVLAAAARTYELLKRNRYDPPAGRTEHRREKKHPVTGFHRHILSFSTPYDGVRGVPPSRETDAGHFPQAGSR